MKLGEQLMSIAVRANNLIKPEHETYGQHVQMTDVSEIMHADEAEELTEIFHTTIQQVSQFGPEVLAAVCMQWVLDAIREYGMPDDIHELPTRQFPPTPTVPTLLG